ncbi:hypothetical protein PSACC_02618 [Paramicrosporidium saccamoebae]|uniref:Arrestin C-terminal-like domain-containing protein n=1 Tax=Paramicrosporidium saccamoebae TaxID=1246581 RepID=A0A2H9TIF3_9FUNG|nr:hypothetical protein PSACC_02618 [Paramicrosporidium saccamoebae]
MSGDKNTLETEENSALASSKWSYASFILFGLAQLTPWNIYIKTVPYFRERLGDAPYAPLVSSYISSSFTIFNFLAMLILVVLRFDELFLNTPQRITIALTGNAALMLVMAIIISIDMSNNAIFGCIVGITAMAGGFTACMIKGMLGMTAGFPPALTPALLAGQAVAGLLSSIANIITKSAGSKGQGTTGPIIYFLVGATVLASAQIVFILNCRHSPFFRHHLGLGTKVVQAVRRAPTAIVKDVFGRIRWFAFGILLVLGITISIFATFLTSPRRFLAPDDGMLALYYVPLIFIIYDAGDFLGRWLPAFSLLAGHPKSLFVQVSPWLRAVVFIPLFIFFAPVTIGRTVSDPTGVFSLGSADLFYAVLTFTFGVSNGYCCTALLMHAPSLAISGRSTLTVNDTTINVESRWEREACGSVMGLFLTTGLLLGSVSSFLWQATGIWNSLACKYIATRKVYMLRHAVQITKLTNGVNRWIVYMPWILALIGCMKTGEVDLKVELPRTYFAENETVKGTAEIYTSCPVKFESAELAWLTQSCVSYEDGDERSTLQNIVHEISEVSGKTVEGLVKVPLEWEVPEATPASVEGDMAERLSVYTMLVVTLRLGAPYGTSIVKEYPIKIISRPKRLEKGLTGGILQSVEFPLRGCFTSGTAAAHLEMACTTFTAGDRVAATVIVDLHDSRLAVHGVSLAIKRIVFMKSEGTEEGVVNEHELFEGPMTGSIGPRQRSVVTVSTIIPEEAFVSDIESESVCISHFALFLFYCPGGYEVETEIPICLIRPEAKL